MAKLNPVKRLASPLGLIPLVLLLAPSAAYLWHFGDVPRFGDLHDDSLYFVSAKSLADGGGYRIESLPGEPAQTKYPPLYPLLLSAAWRLNPQFPANLTAAAWISWLALPAILVLLAGIYARWEFSGYRAWILMLLFAANPYVILFSTQLFSEMPFLALALGVALAIERAAKGSRPAAAWAGAIAGLAYLTRSAGLALLASGAIYLWPLRKQRTAAILFSATMLPFVAGWMFWARLHQVSTDDPTLIYYVDYFRYELYSVSWRDFPLILWKNLDGLLWGLGGWILPKVFDSQFLKILSEVIAIAMISGVVRMVRRGIATFYAVFALFSAALLVVWHFPPNERFVLPLMPLALAGLWTEAGHLAAMLRSARRHPDKAQRAVAAGFVAAIVAIGLGCVALQALMDLSFLPADAAQHRERKMQNAALYDWIRANTAADASFLAADDALLFLNTGRHAMSKPLPPALWYRQDHAGIVEWLSDLAPFAREHALSNFVFAGVDIRQGISDDDRQAVEQAIRGAADLSLVCQTGSATIYKIP